MRAKQLPEAARNYSITELEMCGLAIMSFVYLLQKAEPANTRKKITRGVEFLFI